MLALALTVIGMLGGVQATGWPTARATVQLNVTLVSSETLTLMAVPDPFDGDGAYFVEAAELTTGNPLAEKHFAVYAVIDGRRDKHTPAIALQAADGLELESMQALVAVRLPGGHLAMVSP